MTSSAAARVVKGVETDVLLVALDLADQSAQNAALARLLVGDRPERRRPRRRGRGHPRRRGRPRRRRRGRGRDAGPGRGRRHHARRPAGHARPPTTPRRRRSCAAEQQAHSTDGYTNGNIPLEVLCPVEFAPDHHLRCDAAEALARMNVAYRQAFGHDMVISDSYRSLADQVRTKAAKGGLAAVPGTSNHGWGLAIDLGDGVDSYGSAQYAWLKVNAVLFGWHHPTYMDEGGRGPARAVALGVRHDGRPRRRDVRRRSWSTGSRTPRPRSSPADAAGSRRRARPDRTRRRPHARPRRRRPPGPEPTPTPTPTADADAERATPDADTDADADAGPQPADSTTPTEATDSATATERRAGRRAQSRGVAHPLDSPPAIVWASPSKGRRVPGAGNGRT